MDFPINQKPVIFFETELKPPVPILSPVPLDVDLSNPPGPLSPLQNSKLSKVINESVDQLEDQSVESQEEEEPKVIENPP
jgi:hypothetical protein